MTQEPDLDQRSRPRRRAKSRTLGLFATAVLAGGVAAVIPTDLIHDDKPAYGAQCSPAAISVLNHVHDAISQAAQAQANHFPTDMSYNRQDLEAASATAPGPYLFNPDTAGYEPYKLYLSCSPDDLRAVAGEITNQLAQHPGPFGLGSASASSFAAHLVALDQAPTQVA